MSVITDEHCGNCDADLRATQIPVDSIEKGYYGDKDPNVPHYFSRRIGVEYSWGPPQWMCPDCGYREGCFSGKFLDEGESELRYGGK